MNDQAETPKSRIIHQISETRFQFLELWKIWDRMKSLKSPDKMQSFRVELNSVLGRQRPQRQNRDKSKRRLGLDRDKAGMRWGRDSNMGDKIRPKQDCLLQGQAQLSFDKNENWSKNAFYVILSHLSICFFHTYPPTPSSCQWGV